LRSTPHNAAHRATTHRSTTHRATTHSPTSPSHPDYPSLLRLGKRDGVHAGSARVLAPDARPCSGHEVHDGAVCGFASTTGLTGECFAGAMSFSLPLRGKYLQFCEVSRMVRLWQAAGLPCTWIRYNPDAFKVDGRTRKVPLKQREAMLRAVMKRVRERPLSSMPGACTVIYLRCATDDHAKPGARSMGGPAQGHSSRINPTEAVSVRGARLALCLGRLHTHLNPTGHTPRPLTSPNTSQYVPTGSQPKLSDVTTMFWGTCTGHRCYSCNPIKNTRVSSTMPLRDAWGVPGGVYICVNTIAHVHT